MNPSSYGSRSACGALQSPATKPSNRLRGFSSAPQTPINSRQARPAPSARRLPRSVASLSQKSSRGIGAPKVSGTLPLWRPATAICEQIHDGGIRIGRCGKRPSSQFRSNHCSTRSRKPTGSTALAARMATTCQSAPVRPIGADAGGELCGTRIAASQNSADASASSAIGTAASRAKPSGMRNGFR